MVLTVMESILDISELDEISVIRFVTENLMSEYSLLPVTVFPLASLNNN